MPDSADQSPTELRTVECWRMEATHPSGSLRYCLVCALEPDAHAAGVPFRRDGWTVEVSWGPVTLLRCATTSEIRPSTGATEAPTPTGGRLLRYRGHQLWAEAAGDPDGMWWPTLDVRWTRQSMPEADSGSSSVLDEVRAVFLDDLGGFPTSAAAVAAAVAYGRRWVDERLEGLNP
jgi:hypothetical protein